MSYPHYTTDCNTVRKSQAVVDPNAALARIRELANEWDENEDAAEFLAEEFQALDQWLSRGGFLPKGWGVVVNPNGVIGESTRNEIAYATQRGIPVRYTHDVDQQATPTAGEATTLTPPQDADATVRAIRALHTPFYIYDECGHTHPLDDDDNPTEPGVVLTDFGAVCADGLLYVVCRSCCTTDDGDCNQTEECTDYHDHTAGGAICETAKLLDSTGQGAQS